MKSQIVFIGLDSDLELIDSSLGLISVFLYGNVQLDKIKDKIQTGLIFSIACNEDSLMSYGLPEVVGCLDDYIKDIDTIQNLEVCVSASFELDSNVMECEVGYIVIRMKNFLMTLGDLTHHVYKPDYGQQGVLVLDSHFESSGQGTDYFGQNGFNAKKVKTNIGSNLFGVFDLSELISVVREFRPTHIYLANGNGIVSWNTINYELALFLSNKSIKIIFKTTDTFLNLLPTLVAFVGKDNLLYFINRDTELKKARKLGVASYYSEWAVHNLLFEYQKDINILKNPKPKMVFLGNIVNKNTLIDSVRAMTKKLGTKSKELYVDYLEVYGLQTLEYIKKIEAEYEIDGLLSSFIELQRVNLFERMFNFGVDFETYGNYAYWEHLKSFKYCNDGTKLDREIYTESTLMVDFMRAGQDDVFLGDRVPKIFACKGLVAMNGYTRDIYTKYTFDERLYYSNPGELLDTYYYFVENPQARYELIEKYQEFTNLYREDDIMRKLTDTVF